MMMKMDKLREKTSENLGNLCDDLRAEIYQLKCELSLNRKVEKPHLLRGKRHLMAKAMTVLTERKKEGK